MTAVDLDALDAARAAASPTDPATWTFDCLTPADAALIVAAVNALPDLIAAARERDALRDAVLGLAEQWAEMGRDHDEQGASNTALVYKAHARHLRAVVTATLGEGA